MLFDPTEADELAFIRKRAAQLFSKSRFIAAQFDAYFEDGLWLETARHANAMAARLAGHIGASEIGAARLGAAGQRGLRDHAERRRWNALQEGRRVLRLAHAARLRGAISARTKTLCRFVTSFATTAEDVDRFGELIA